MDAAVFFCHNNIVISRKDYTQTQLKLLYSFIRYYTTGKNYGVIEKRKVIMPKREIRNIIKKYKIGDITIEQIVSQMPKEIWFLDNEVKEIGFISVFDYLKYDTEEREFEFAFNESILPYLDNVTEHFAKLDLREIEEMKGKHSLRMYEMACKFMNQKYYKVKIKSLRRYFGINDKYKMSNIDRDVLGKSIEEIESKTNKRIKYNKVKDGGVVTHINFYFSTVE